VNTPHLDSSITLVRHGESTWNELGLIQGQNDLAQLTEVGRDQARAVAESLKSLGFDRLVASDLVRARQTAEIIGSGLGLIATSDSLLRERCFGVLEGEPQEMLDSERSGIVNGVIVNPDARPEGGESFRDVVTRAGIFIEATRDLLNGERLLVVTHGGTIRALRAYVEARPLEGLDAVAVANCSVWDLYPSSVD
jgi:2,3-bisphosphoglycerate-dependent phosphoglycerate mutase